MRLAKCLLAAGLITGCSLTNYNQTVYPYLISSEVQAPKSQYKKVMVAPPNLLLASKQYLSSGEQRVRTELVTYLKKQGFEIVPADDFSITWKNAQTLFGNTLNPTTGKVNQPALLHSLAYSLMEIKKDHDVDAVVFMDLIESKVFFSDSGNHNAVWDGVRRSPTLIGPDNYVEGGFNWHQPVSAVSIAINIYSMDGKHLFKSQGGIEITDAVNTKKFSQFSRKNRILQNETHIKEGIALALHPFSPMKNYPAPSSNKK